MTNIGDNTYELTVGDATLKLGKGTYFGTSDGFTAIDQPTVSGNKVTITQSEIKRLGSYKLYINGVDAAVVFFSTWTDRNGRELSFMEDNCFYYYFRRKDCGVVVVNNVHGEPCRTDLHYALGRTQDSLGRAIEVLEK